MSSPGQGYLIKRTARLLSKLDNDRARILIPAPVVSEYLIGTPKEHWTAVIDHFRKRFFVATFDLACAHEAARIWMDATGGKKLSEVEWLAGIGKQKIKYDVQLLAIAIRNDADVIYSHDPDIRR